MTLDERLDLLAELGHYLRQPADAELETVVHQAYMENRWFTPDNTHAALKAIAQTMLDRKALTEWAARYHVSTLPHPSHTIGLVMAGNIPLVGFHDWLCVFVAGQRAKIKLSEKDKRLLPFLVKKMGEWAFESWEYTEFLGEHDRLGSFDAVIATGSNNTARYFEQYFGRHPHIIRGHRNAVAVLDGTETAADLYALGRDIFAYFGLGCRNVSKLYVPEGYDFNLLLEALHEYREIIQHDKYKNNFDYNFTLYILNRIPYLGNGCLLLREDPALTSRIASAHYEYYANVDALKVLLEQQQDQIQCVAARAQFPDLAASLRRVPFGGTQSPKLDDYPDGVDVMAWLSTIS